jgi:hypothetical protein
MVALGLALGASIAWGGSDFLAGLVTRRLPVLTVLAPLAGCRARAAHRAGVLGGVGLVAAFGGA